MVFVYKSQINSFLLFISIENLKFVVFKPTSWEAEIWLKCLRSCLQWWLFVVSRRLLQNLSDRGKKVQDFADKLRFTIEQRIEEERRRDQDQQGEGQDSREMENSPDNTILEKRQDTSAAEHSLKSEETNESELLQALDRVQLSKFKEQLNTRETTNYFIPKTTQKKPHYVTVLDKGQSSSHAVEQRFKTNQ